MNDYLSASWRCVGTVLIILFLARAQVCLADLSSSEVTGMLTAHNDVRASAAPSAADMTRLVWDASRASVAQSWANQCNFSHNANRNANYAALSSNSGGVGENIDITTGTRASALSGANSAVGLWPAEASAYHFATNTCASGQVCGHYTQLAWANTLHVGCGITQCPTVIGASGFNNAQVVICDYNPAGNFVGQRPHVQGAPASQCPAGLPDNIDNLCSPAVGGPAHARTVSAVPPLGLAVFALALAGIAWRTSIARTASRD